MLDLQAIEQAINIISVEKKIAKEKLVEIIEHAIKTAYKRDYASKEANVNVHLDLAAGTLEIGIEKEIVATEDDVEDEESTEENSDGDEVSYSAYASSKFKQELKNTALQCANNLR